MNFSFDAHDATPDTLVCVCSDRCWIRNPKPLRCRLRVGLQWILPRPECKSWLCCTRHMTFWRVESQRWKRRMGVNSTNQRDGSLLSETQTHPTGIHPAWGDFTWRQSSSNSWVCSVESFSDRWGKQWMLASLLHDSFLVEGRWRWSSGVSMWSVCSHWHFFDLFSSFLYFAIMPKIKAPLSRHSSPFWLLHPAFSSTSVESGLQTNPLFSLSRPWHLIPSQISHSEISKRKLMWTLSHFNICEDVASNLPLTHAQH